MDVTAYLAGVGSAVYLALGLVTWLTVRLTRRGAPPTWGESLVLVAVWPVLVLMMFTER